MSEDKWASPEEPEGKVIYRWKPELGKDYRDEEDLLIQDMAQEYLIVERPEAQSGIIIFARYRRGGWQANPWSLRPLVRHLLRTRIERLQDLATHPVLVIKADSQLKHEDLERLREEMARAAIATITPTTVEILPQPLVIAIGLDDSIETLSEADMARHGWFRKPPEEKLNPE